MRSGWLLFLLAISASASGCDPEACRSHTLRLTLSYGFPSSSADRLTLDVRVGATLQRYQKQLTGSAHDTLEVAFASYPAGAAVTVEAAVARDGQTIAGGRSESTLKPDCSALTVALAGAGSTSDLGAGTGDLAGSPSDQGPHPGADLAGAPPDLASATPALSLPDQHNSALSATNSTGGTLYEDRCPSGYALIGFNLSMSSAILDDKGICARVDLKPVLGGGWQGTWGPTVFLPYHGTTGDPGTQVVCPTGSFVRGFSGWSAAYVESILFLCATVVVSADDEVSLSYNGATSLYGQNLGMDYGTIICPTNEIAVMRRETRGTNLPPASFGLACSSIHAN
jgi:hypothetical protein